MSARWSGTYIGTVHVTSSADEAANDAIYWHADVLLKIFRARSDTWGIFYGTESAVRYSLYQIRCYQR